MCYQVIELCMIHWQYSKGELMCVCARVCAFRFENQEQNKNIRVYTLCVLKWSDDMYGNYYDKKETETAGSINDLYVFNQCIDCFCLKWEREKEKNRFMLKQSHLKNNNKEHMAKWSPFDIWFCFFEFTFPTLNFIICEILIKLFVFLFSLSHANSFYH